MKYYNQRNKVKVTALASIAWLSVKCIVKLSFD